MLKSLLRCELAQIVVVYMYMLHNYCLSCNLIGFAQIPAENKVNANKVSQSYQTNFCEQRV